MGAVPSGDSIGLVITDTKTEGAGAPFQTVGTARASAWATREAPHFVPSRKVIERCGFEVSLFFSLDIRFFFAYSLSDESQSHVTMVKVTVPCRTISYESEIRCTGSFIYLQRN